MKKLPLIVAFILGWVSGASAAPPAPLTSLRAVHELTNAEASHALPATFEATVTYYRDVDFNLFVQENGDAIYVYFKPHAGLVPGDRVLVKGVTRDSFRPVVIADQVILLHHGAAPKPRPASFDELIRAELSCLRVTVRGKVRSADLVWSVNAQNIYLQLLTDGGYIDAAVNSEDATVLKGLLDADVEVTGGVAVKFDGKKQLTGIVIWVQSIADVKVLQRAKARPESLPVTPMDRILATSHVSDQTGRVRVQGTITYYQPGSSIALQNGSKSLWIMTMADAPMQVGDLADVTGFPDVRNGFLTLTHSEIRDSNVQSPIAPRPVTWREIETGANAFDLVSVKGKLMMEVRETSQDEYILVSEGHLLSAIYHHPNRSGNRFIPPLVQIPLGSEIRITGISMYYSSDPFNGPLDSHMLLRSPADIVVLANPSGISTKALVRAVSVLLLIVIAVAVWGWKLQVEMHRQTKAQAARNKVEAELERSRSRILEDINGSRALPEIIEKITDMVSLQINGAPCWFKIADGALLGKYPGESNGLRIVSEEISSRNGLPLGRLFTGLAPGTPLDSNITKAISQGSRLAALAIESRRLYADLLHRSEFDQLTDIHNRGSLDRILDAQIEEARQKAGIFGLIYIDLDDFKQVNDLYGHQVGDLYLQEVALRMKRQLRPHDMLARLGGDEFAVVVPMVRSRAEVEEIAVRLEQCLDDDFAVENYALHGSASVGVALYPEDATTKDSLLSAADAAMYVAKHTRQQAREL
jgi:diguanylate cyclase (GGDEF)-like protein